MLRNCLSALLNSLSFNYSEEKDSRKIKRQKIVSRSRTLRFEPCEDRTMLSVSPFNSEDVTAHWTFDVNTEDTNGAFVGTLNNGASLTTNGIAGGGLSLDGVDDFFSIGDPEELQIINEITLSAWIIPESASGTQNIIAKGYSTHPNGEIFLRIANGKYQVGSWTGSNHMAEFAIPSSDIGERVHLAGTYDGMTWRLYRNGVEIASTVDNIGAVEVDGAWAVGARGTGTERFFNGVIDEVVISSSVYTAQEIAALASIPTNAQEDNSVTWNWSDVQNGEIYSEQGDSLGTLSNGAVVQFDSAYGQVLNLSGNNGYVSLGNPDDLQIHGEITLSAWICPNSFTGIQNIIAKGHSSNPNGEIFLRIANGEYQVGSWNGTNYYASAIADTDDIGQWIQLTGVYDGTAWRLYKNGVLAASLSTTVGAVPVSADWSIGSNGSGSTRFFNGKIGNGGIYDHALDAQSVAALMTDSQTTARVGGNSYAIKDQSYVLQLEASHPNVLWTVNWGDGTTDEYYNASSASHIYTHYGTSGVSVTAKRNGQTIDVAGSSISLQIGSVDEMIINGNFEDVAIPNGTYWAIYDTIPGWTGPVEIQINNGSKVAELDTDNRTSGLDTTLSDGLPHHTTITSCSMDFTPGLIYTLNFDAWNRSDYAQDNILNVTVPGEIISVNGNTPVSTLLDLIDENDLGAFSFTSISYDSVTFSAGGSYCETDDGNGGTVYTLGASPFHVSSITFVATSNSGSVSFSDVSSDVIPGYGLLLDNISMNQEYLYVDIDVDSNNDGIINDFDDPIEMETHGMIITPGASFQLKTHLATSLYLSSEFYGTRILIENSELLSDSNLSINTDNDFTITLQDFISEPIVLTYEVFSKLTYEVIACDQVLINMLEIGLQPYTPETEHVDPLPIPKEKWSVNGVGIRRNSDFDYGGACTTPDYNILGSIPKENDLIKTQVLFNVIDGIEYVLRVDNENLKFWKSSTKNGNYHFVNGECILTASGYIWAEYASEDDSDYTLTLIARDVATKHIVYSEEMIYRPFNSVTCAFVGELQTAGLMDNNHGVNLTVRELLLDGYDVHVWDDGHDWWSWDEADEWGRGPAYDVIVNAVNNHKQSKISLFGYSHGGGTVYNVSWRISNNYNDSKGNNLTGEYSLVYTSYIDAVANARFSDLYSERRRPEDSLYHTNQYQENTFIRGISIPSSNEDIDRSSIEGINHKTIDDNDTVLNLLKTTFKLKVIR